MTRRLTWLSAVALAATVLVPLAPSAPTAQAAATTTSFCNDRAATEAPLDESLESYTPINPTRLVDTRDGTGGVGAALGRGCTLRLNFSSSIVPVDATAVSLSLTGVADKRGFLTAYPCETGRPETSNLNVRVGIGTPNLVVGLLDSTRSLCIYSNAGSHIVVDLAGWWSPGPDRFNSIDPVRAYDTRELAQPLRLPAGHVRDVPIAGSFVPGDATAAVVTLTATDALNQGWISVFPCGETPPITSNLNVRVNEARAVSAIVGLGTDPLAKGKICIQSNITTHVIIDVNGYYAPAPQFGPTASLRPLAGERIADSREGIGGWSTPFKAGEVRSFDPVAGLPHAGEASAVMLNVIGVDAPERGHLRVYPCGEVVESSAVNYSNEGAATNLVPVSLSDEGRVCIYAHKATDVVVDLFGVMTAPDGSFAEQLSFGSTDVWPPFSPDGTDYGVRCAAGGNVLDIHLDLLPSATARIDGKATSSGDSVKAVVTDDLLPITMSRNGVTKEYYFRCLPADFPVLEVDRSGEPTPGWYLTTFGQGRSPSGTFTVILDDYGAPVWYKRVDEPLVNFQLRPDGTLRASSQGNKFGIPEDDVLHRISDLDGNLRDVRGEPVDKQMYPVDHHDYVDIPGGGWANLTYRLRTGEDLRAMGIGYLENDAFVDSSIREFDKNGVDKFNWSASDYFSEVESTYPQRFGNYKGEPGVDHPDGEVNLHHMNSLMRVEDGSGDYVASARHMDAVFRIDRSSGDVKWILGSLPSDPGADGYIANKSGAPRLTIIGDPFNGTRRQHDARLVGDVLTVFDNRTDTGEPARAVAYRIDEVNLTATMLWQIQAPSGQTSSAQGSNRRAADGSTLIGWGVIQPVFSEFDAAGDRLMEITQVHPDGGTPAGISYRIIKYPSAAFDIAQLREKAGGDAEAPTP